MKKKSGNLNVEEAKMLHANLFQNKMTIHPFDVFRQEIDSDGDGKISFNEYIQWLLDRGFLKVHNL